MNTKTIDCTDSNPCPTPVPLDGSPAERPLLSALVFTLLLGSLSMLAAFPGTASAQIAAAKDCISRPGSNTGSYSSTCAHDVSMSGSRTINVGGGTCTPRTGVNARIDAGSTGSISASANPQTVCLEYVDAATQYSSGYAACNVTGCGSSGVTYSEAAQLPAATINLADVSVNEGASIGQVIFFTLNNSQASLPSNVVIDFTSNNSDVTISPAQLTFTEANKSAAQRITISAANDSDGNDESATITAKPAITSGAYLATGTFTVNVTDDEYNTRPAAPHECISGRIGTLNGQPPSQTNRAHFFATRVDPAPTGCRVSDAFVVKGKSRIGLFGTPRCDFGGDFNLEIRGGVNENSVEGTGSTGFTTPATMCVEYKDPAKQRASGYDFCLEPSSYDCGSGQINIAERPPRGDFDFNQDSVTFTEGGTFDLTIKIDSILQVTGNVTVSVTKTSADITMSDEDGNAISGNTHTLSFTPATLGTAQTISFTSPDDADEVNLTDDLTIQVTTSNIVVSTRVLPITVEDGDRPTGQIVASGGLGITLTEGDVTGQKIDVYLSSERTPLANSIVDISVDNSDITITPSMLTFTPANFGIAQTITLTAGRDNDKTDDTGGTLTFASTQAAIALATVKKTVRIDEPPTGTIETSPLESFTIPEGLSAILKVRLSTRPTTPESTVRISNTNPKIRFDTDPHRGGRQDTLTFKNSGTEKLYNEYQDVVFTAARDSDIRNDSDTITLVFTDGGLNDVPALTVPTIHAEPPTGTIVVSPAANLKITEGVPETIGVRLSTTPNTDVRVRVSNTNNEVSVDADLNQAYLQYDLTFTPQNYAVIQTYTILAANDGDRHGGTDVLTFSSSGGINSNDATLDVEILDKDVPRGTIEVNPVNFSVREGFSGALSVKLSAEPNRDVVVDVSLSKIYSGVTVSPETLTFTIANWNTIQTVIVSAARDRNTIDDTNTITFSPSATGGLVAPDVIRTFNVYDAEISPTAAHHCVGYYELTGGGIGFGGYDNSGNSRFTCTSGNVRVYVNYLVSSSGTGSCSPQSHEISSGPNGGREFNIQSSAINWCAEYSNSETQRQSGFESCRTLSCPGANDTGHTLEIGSVIEPGGIGLSARSIDLEEHERRSFDVTLESDPTLPVIVYLKSSDPHVSLDPQSLLFNRGDWFAGQTVTVTSEGDKDSDDHRGRISLEAVGGNYHGVRASLPLTVVDNESTIAPEPNDARYWPVQSHAFAIPPVTAQDQATVRIRCRQNTPCIVYLDCSDQENGSLYRGILSSRGQPVATIPAWGTRTLDAEDIVSITGRSWDGNGRLACAFRSHAKIASQVWTRSGEGVLVNNSEAIRSDQIDNTHRADIESIPAPGGADDTNLRIRCTAALGEHCTGTRFTCYGDDGTMHDGTVGTIRRLSVRHMQTSELSDIINHRWMGMGLSCEVTSDHPFSVQVLTRTGGGGALVNNSATGG